MWFRRVSLRCPHQCVYGHQIRACAGVRLPNGDACQMRCEDMVDTSEIYFNGSTKSWLQFKEYQSSLPQGWNYDDMSKNPFRQKQLLYLWKKVGNHFCSIHNMKFVEFNNETDAKNLHYIFALDESGSMDRPDKWPQVIKTLSQTLINIKSLPNYQQIVKITILMLSDDFRSIYENQSPNNIKLKQIEPNWGGTNFARTFEAAYALMKKYHEHDHIIFILLTDGESAFPTEQIRLIKQLQRQPNIKIYYSGIQFQTQTQEKTMKDINIQLEGKSFNVNTPQQLLKAFDKAI